MSIETTYRELILEQIIKDILSEGTVPTVSEITSQFNTYVEDNDLSQPLFNNTDYKVISGSCSSALLMKNTNISIQRDLKTIYRHLLQVSEQAIVNFERWRAEARLLEGQLNNLTSRIENLLLVSQDTAGYLNFVQDDFNDLSKTDLTYTTAYVNPVKKNVSMGTTSLGATKIDLSGLQDADIEFAILTKNNLSASVSSEGSKLIYAFADQDNYWQERVLMSKITPVSTELKIKLGDEAVSFSKIEVDLHMSNSAGSIQFTPMYSDDAFSWNQLPITNFTASIVDKYIFQFSTISAKYVKFIMTKQGCDLVHNGLYAYEFGVDEISFYDEAFEVDTTYDFVSKPLYVNNINGTPQEFNKVVLEVCENIPDSTRIDYYVAASNTSTVPVSDDIWVPIDPLNREKPVQPTLIDFGELPEVTISGFSISYDASSSGDFINPARSFTLVNSISGTTPSTSTITSSAKRYAFQNSNDMILSYELASAVDIAENTLEVWRNAKSREEDYTVRDIINGWGFSEPYYFCAVWVSNPAGTTIDFGPKPILIDGEAITGKKTVAYGAHSIKVVKDRWEEIDDPSDIHTLAALKAADTLYPYNHRYLIEGFTYPADWSDTEEKIYSGFDIVAEYYMKEVSVFDLLNNVKSDDYEKFAIDWDAGDTGISRSAAKVFLLKVDSTQSDWTDEKFILKFKSVDTLYQYLRFKAVFKTSDSSIVPYLDGYRIKMSS